MNLSTAIEMFRSLVTGLERDGYLQEWFGYHCVDDGDVPGRGGDNASAFAYRRTRLADIWPPSSAWDEWDEVGLFTAIEF